MKRLIFLPILLFVLGVGTSSVFACIGYEEEPFYIENLATVPTLVLGTVLDVDESGTNALFQVERYLIGEGMAQIVHSRHFYGLYSGASLRDYDTGCFYSGGGNRFTVGSRGYFAFAQGGFGSYTDGSSNYNQGYPQFIIEQDTIRYISRETGEGTASQAEFEALLAPILGDNASNFYPTDYRRPLMRPLLLTTEAGSHYQINVDYSLGYPEFNEQVHFSPDGSHRAFFGEENKVLLSDFWNSTNSFEITGDNALFSPDSNFVLVWNAEELHLIMFENWEYSDFAGREMGIEELATLELDNPSRFIWSDNSGSIAFVDDAGIWYWNFFYAAEPQLIVPGESALLELSPTGRFLRYGTNQVWTLLNTATGESFENVLASPDELNLIYISHYPEHLNSELVTPCDTPLPHNCPVIIYPQGEMTDYFWYRREQIAILSCTETECILTSYSWNASIRSYPPSDLYLGLPPVRQIIYEAEYDLAAYVTGDYEIQIGLNYLPEQRTILELSSQIDSPIIHIEWGQPIFHEERS